MQSGQRGTRFDFGRFIPCKCFVAWQTSKRKIAVEICWDADTQSVERECKALVRGSLAAYRSHVFQAWRYRSNIAYRRSGSIVKGLSVIVTTAEVCEKCGLTTVCVLWCKRRSPSRVPKHFHDMSTGFLCTDVLHEFIFYLLGGVVVRASDLWSTGCEFDSRSYTAGSVLGWVTGTNKPSRYVTSHLGQLSLPSLPSGVGKSSTTPSGWG